MDAHPPIQLPHHGAIMRPSARTHSTLLQFGSHAAEVVAIDRQRHGPRELAGVTECDGDKKRPE